MFSGVLAGPALGSFSLASRLVEGLPEGRGPGCPQTGLASAGNRLGFPLHS